MRKSNQDRCCIRPSAVLAKMLKYFLDRSLNVLIALIVRDAGKTVEQREPTGEQTGTDYHR